ncbi:MAG: tetratricopeptide repeat protein [Planctomycetota bacterium]
MSIFTALLGTTALYFWHAHATKQLASRFLERGAEYAADEDFQKASEEVWRFLRFQPKHQEGRRRLADYHYRFATAEPAVHLLLRCIQFHHHAISVIEDASLEESRLAELQLLAGEFGEARRNALRLIDDETHHDAARRIAGLATYRAVVRGDTIDGDPTAGELLSSALRSAPTDADLAKSLADTFRSYPNHLSDRQRKNFPLQADQLARADAIMSMLVNHAGDAEAYIARADYRARFGLDGVAADLREAAHQQPRNFTLRLRLARRLLQPVQSSDEQAVRLNEAETHVTELLAKDPKSAAALETLGDIFMARNKVEDAIRTWKDSIANAEKSPLSVGVFLKVAETQINRGEFSDSEEVLRQLETRLKSTGLRQRMPPRLRVSLDQSLAMLRGLSAARQDQFVAAIESFRAVIDLNVGDREIASLAWSRLGQCYTQVGAHDVAADCFGRAAQEDPSDTSLLNQAAEAWFRAGQPGQAIEYYKRLTSLESNAANWLALARAIRASERGLEQKLTEKSLRRAIENATRLAESAPPEIAWEVRLAAIQIDHVGHDESSISRTRERLDRLSAGLPDNARLRQKLQSAYAAIGHPSPYKIDDQDPILRASSLTAAGQIDEAIASLREAIGDDPRVAKMDLRLALLTATWLKHEDPSRAGRDLEAIWESCHQTDDDLRRIVNLAVRADLMTKQPSTWEQALPRLEGEEGHWSLYLQSRRDIRLAALADSERQAARHLEDATIKQQRLFKARPLWPWTHDLAGDIAASSGRTLEAVNGYKRSIELGNRDPVLVLKLVELLYLSNALVEAERYLPLIDNLEQTEKGFKVKYSVLRGLNQLDRAESLARRVQRKSGSAPAASDLALSQILMAQGQLDEAEQRLLGIVEDDTANKEVATMSLFNLYVRRGDTEQAAETLERLLNLNAADRTAAEQAFLHAQGAMLLKRPDAGRYFEAAAKDADATLAMCLGAAIYFVERGDLDRAIEHARRARRLEQADAAGAAAYPILARALAARGTEHDWVEIQQLRAQYAGDKGEQREVDRLHALLVTQKSAATNDERRKNLLQAMELMRRANGASAVDDLMIARVQHQLSDLEPDEETRRLLREKTIASYERVSYAPDATATHLREVAAFYLGEEMTAACELVLARAEEADRESSGQRSVDSLALRVQLLAKTGRASAAEALMKQFAETAVDKQNAFQALGDICMRAEMMDAAQQWLQRVENDSLGVFARRVQTAHRRGQVGEALAMCRTRFAAESESPEARRAVLRIISTILSVPGTSREDHARAENTLLAAEHEMARDPIALDALATVRLIQGRRNDALRLFAIAVKLSPNNPALLNNLATALSSDPASSKNALALLNRAVAVLGRETPELLDTRASILLHNDPAQAETVWRKLENERADPRVTLQLADALMRQGKSVESAEKLQLAVERGVSNMVLTPSQRQTLRRLHRQHGSTTTTSVDAGAGVPQT